MDEFNIRFSQVTNKATGILLYYDNLTGKIYRTEDEARKIYLKQPPGFTIKRSRKDDSIMYLKHIATGKTFFKEEDAQTFVSSQTNDIPEVCGINNVGNMCYMDSAIQMLYFIDDFRNNILNSRDSHNPYIQAMRILFLSMKNAPMNERASHKILSPKITRILLELDNQRGAFVNLRVILNTLLSNTNEIGRQEDAQEFINGLFNKINYSDKDNIDIKKTSYYSDDKGNVNILEPITATEVLTNTCIYGGSPMDPIRTLSQLFSLKRESSIDWTKEVDVQSFFLVTEDTMNTIDGWCHGCSVPDGIKGFTRGPCKKLLSYEVTPRTKTVVVYIPPETPPTRWKSRSIEKGKEILKELNGIDRWISHTGDNFKEVDNTVNRYINRLEKQVSLNKDLLISNSQFRLSGYILHLGESYNGGHYIYIKCDENGIPSMVIDDESVILAANDERSSLDYQKRNAYVACYTRIDTPDSKLVEAIRLRNETKLKELDAQIEEKKGKMDWTNIKKTYLDNYLRDLLSKLDCPNPGIHGAEYGYLIKEGGKYKVGEGSPTIEYNKPLLKYNEINLDEYLSHIKPGDTYLADVLINIYKFKKRSEVRKGCPNTTSKPLEPIIEKIDVKPIYDTSSLDDLRNVLKYAGVVPLTDSEILNKTKEWGSSKSRNDAGLVKLRVAKTIGGRRTRRSKARLLR